MLCLFTYLIPQTDDIQSFMLCLFTYLIPQTDDIQSFMLWIWSHLLCNYSQPSIMVPTWYYITLNFYQNLDLNLLIITKNRNENEWCIIVFGDNCSPNVNYVTNVVFSVTFTITMTLYWTKILNDRFNILQRVLKLDYLAEN